MRSGIATMAVGARRKWRIAMVKYSLGTLFLVVAVVSFGCAAVANFSKPWAEVTVTSAVMVLLIGVLGAVLGSRRIRPFAIGFAVVGWAYFLLAFVEVSGLRDELLTDRAVNWLYAVKQRWSAGSNADGMVVTAAGMPGGGEYGGYDSGSGYGADMGMTSGGIPGGGSRHGYGAEGPVLSDLFNEPMTVGYYPTYTPTVAEAPSELKNIGHALWTLLLALIGGVLGHVIHRASHQDDRPS
jgi:hypothetical protein